MKTHLGFILSHPACILERQVCILKSILQYHSGVPPSWHSKILLEIETRLSKIKAGWLKIQPPCNFTMQVIIVSRNPPKTSSESHDTILDEVDRWERLDFVEDFSDHSNVDDDCSIQNDYESVDDKVEEEDESSNNEE